MSEKLKAIGEWFKSKPGRKRTAAVVILVAAAVLRGFEMTGWADAISGLNSVVQVAIDTGDISGVLLGIFGILDAKKKGKL